MPIKQISFIENKPYTKNEIVEILSQVFDYDLNRVIFLLADKGYLHRFNEARNVFVFDDLSIYSFSFVGVCLIGGTLFKFYPKYFEIDDCIADENNYRFKAIIKAIAKYDHEKKEDTETKGEIESHNADSLLSTMLFLKNDYEEYGLYENDQTIDVMNGKGRINWNKTINQISPLLNDDEIFYPDFYAKKQIANKEDYIRTLHGSIIENIYSSLTDYGLDDIFDISLCDSPNIETIDINREEKDVNIAIIRKELNIQFYTRKIEVLKAMVDYLDKETHLANEIDGLVSYGTSSFEHVWEEACKRVFDDIYSSKYFSYCGEAKTLKQLVPNPIICNSEGQTVTQMKTLIPDLITIQSNRFIIIDAKYYLPKFSGSSLQGMPELESIIKQYLYNLAFVNFINSKNLLPENYFVIPKNRHIQRKYYQVNFPIFNNISQNISKKIEIVFADADTLFNDYLIGQKRSIDYFRIGLVEQKLDYRKYKCDNFNKVNDLEIDNRDKMTKKNHYEDKS